MPAIPARPERATRRRAITVAVAVAALVLPMLAGPATPATAADRPAVQPLPANLEAIRAAEATALYGSPAIRPIEQRRTALITMGDSEISGEGVGNYVPGTHQDGNWCDRSYDQAVFRTGIPSDAQYNIACSGATPWNLIAGGPTQHNELNQGDYLGIKARNTHVKLIWVVVGANGDGTIQFGPVATDCAIRRVFFQGACYPTYTDQWTIRTDGSRRAVEDALTDIRQTMTNAGYLRSDYELVLMSYPEPGQPGRRGQPELPRLVLRRLPALPGRRGVRPEQGGADVRVGAARGGRARPAPAIWTPAGSSTATRCAPTTPRSAASTSRSGSGTRTPPGSRSTPTPAGTACSPSASPSSGTPGRTRPPASTRPAPAAACSTRACWSSSSCATWPPAPASTARGTTPATAPPSSRTAATAGATRASGTTRPGGHCTRSCPTTVAWTSPADR